MEIKKMIIVLSITISIIFGIMLGISYGWYAYSNAETSVKGSTIKEAPTIIFTQNEYISSNINMPIYDIDRYIYANKNSFSITLGKNLKDYNTAIEISLEDIAISNELKIPNYKYELLQNGKTIANGDFSTIENQNKLVIVPMTMLDANSYPETYRYELFVWLSDDGTNQNNLMNKEFSAKININSAIKR